MSELQVDVTAPVQSIASDTYDKEVYYIKTHPDTVERLQRIEEKVDALEKSIALLDFAGKLLREK